MGNPFSIRRTVALCTLAAVPLTAASLVARAAEPDVVYLNSQSAARGQARLECEVLDDVGGEIQLRLADGREVRYPSERVERIETTRTAAQIAAEQALAAGDLRQALAQFKRAVADDRRQWIRRKLLAELVWCYRGLDDLSAAARTFLVLLESDQQTPDFDAIPLLWEAREPEPQLTMLARSWIQEKKSPAADLLGASYLLATADQSVAVDSLRRLERSNDPRIASLAHAQLWRQQIVQPRPGQTEGWQSAIEHMPERLQGGPYFVLGQALARQPDQARAAALAYLRVPILYSRDRSLSAAALLAAGEALEKSGDASDAGRLYDELVKGYANTIPAREAQARLDELRTAPAG